MMPHDYDYYREQAVLQLGVIDAKIDSFTASVAETSAQRDTTPEQIAMMEHLLGLFEELRTGYRKVLEAFDQDRPELAGKWLELMEDLRTGLLQRLGPV